VIPCETYRVFIGRKGFLLPVISIPVTRRVKGYTRKYVTGKFVTGRRKRFRLANGK